MKTFLHVGCGPLYVDPMTKQPSRPQGFDVSSWNELRLDINPAVNPDVVGTMTDMSAVRSGSVDAIFSSHNIEHLYPHEVPIALAEFKRVLRSDGFVVITCPDLQSVCALVAQGKLTEPAYISPAGPIAPLDILYGHRPPMSQGNLYMSHRCGFTLNVLLGTLESAGFSKVVGSCRPNYFDLWALACVSNVGDEQSLNLARQHLPEQPVDLSQSNSDAQNMQQAIQDVLALAQNHQRDGNLDEAKSLFLEILNIEPRHAEANYGLGLIEANQKGAADALPRLEAAVESNPAVEQYWVTYVDALVVSGITHSIPDMLVLGQQHGLKPETAQVLAGELAELLKSR
ncbi:MAG: methyltransferase domain-containing protein [Methylotenera sp.]|nr:methyltransferase domain-containing protein [Methylotenera sp.]MDP2101896.1 methyltransferase domain-containing protein [Methylotenera sp.]MDP2281381.1 methyltransferase domain-containing protein [Methylotenera sp.]MDP2402691.1 methyltransferase domain-containing protein [Methylotenera sp.]MDP3061117.1 methyltransferase domain-containing protein [Methylotenera sp.]